MNVSMIEQPLTKHSNAVFSKVNIKKTELLMKHVGNFLKTRFM